MADVTDKDREAAVRLLRSLAACAMAGIEEDVAAAAIARARAEGRAEGYADAVLSVCHNPDHSPGSLAYALREQGRAECAADITALKARLALAEAVCESCEDDYDMDDSGGEFPVQRYSDDALAAWRAAK